MMHCKAKQNWSIGATVKVGFLTLVIVGKRPTPGDYRPDVWLMQSADGSRRYEFTPHLGLVRIDQ